MQYLKENQKNEVDFLLVDKHQRFLQIDTLILGVCVARHAQITQNNKFVISLQYLQKEVRNKVYFLHADKHESFLQIDTMVFDGEGQAFPNFPKLQVCNIFTISYNILKKKLEMKLVFYIQINIKISYKLISTL